MVWLWCYFDRENTRNSFVKIVVVHSYSEVGSMLSLGSSESSLSCLFCARCGVQQSQSAAAWTAGSQVWETSSNRLSQPLSQDDSRSVSRQEVPEEGGE